MSQNETFFNEHMTKVHRGKHCRAVDEESSTKQRISGENLHEGGMKKRPCRYFRNGVNVTPKMEAVGLITQ